MTRAERNAGKSLPETELKMTMPPVKGPKSTITPDEIQAKWTIDEHGFRCVWAGEWFLEYASSNSLELRALVKFRLLDTINTLRPEADENIELNGNEVCTPMTYDDLRAAWLAVTEDAARRAAEPVSWKR